MNRSGASAVLLIPLLFTVSQGLSQTLEFSGSAVWVRNLDKEVLHAFNRYNSSQQDWRDVFPVVLTNAPDRAIDGVYDVHTTAVSFTPRFPFSKKAEYTATFHTNALTLNYNEIYLPKSDAHSMTLTFFGAVEQQPDPAVLAVFPSADVLPENQLKFHIQFNSSMATGEIYNRVKLINSKGKIVEKAFLLLDQELWDNEMTVATILLDPGRIKRGLRPNMEMGTALKRNEKYTLQIDGGWRDVNGNLTKQGFQKVFTCSEPDRSMPDHESWDVLSPVSSVSPLLIELREAMDFVILPESFIVLDGLGHKVSGKFELRQNESTVAFTPDVEWKDGDYTLYINPLLEDLAGNNLNRLFDEDISERTSREERTVVSRPFSVRLIQN
jgi:hypothetical protein